MANLHRSLTTRKIVMMVLVTLSFSWLGCQAGGSQNGESSQPLNQEEAANYKRALLLCYKTGGTRVVKIEGNLRCF